MNLVSIADIFRYESRIGVVGRRAEALEHDVIFYQQNLRLALLTTRFPYYFTICIIRVNFKPHFARHTFFADTAALCL